MPPPPTGTVTFLYTDIEGSTKLAQLHPNALPTALARHHAILRHAIESTYGYVFQIVGDAFCAAFATATDALRAALMAQRELQTEPWGTTGPIRVRMGLHTGAAEWHTNKYDGYFTLAHTQHLMSAGHGGQVLLSQPTYDLLRDHLPDGVTLRDLGEWRLKDLNRAERIFQLVAPDLPQDFAPLKTLDSRPNNLPIQPTSFIGRQKETVEVKRLLASTHLLTLTGVGGTGKTRLALQVAAEVLDTFPDGVWLIELAPLADPNLVPQIVATVLGVREAQGRPLLTTLSDDLRAKNLLVILDNCEHLLEACAQFADAILHTCPNVRILASSREALGIAGEQTFHVPSLRLPNSKNQIPTAELAQYESVKLFIERACAIKSDFALTNVNAPAVVQVCQRLDGIPLAIELAAARIKIFPPEQIAARLDDRFRLLTGGSRTARPRQQTLRATIDWSYELLSGPERALLRRLSVFVGGWTLAAAEAVCAEKDKGGSRKDETILPSSFILHPSDVLDLLTQLVSKSLVLAEAREGESRYRMLETFREYAQHKLEASGERDQIRDQHLGYFVKYAEEGAPLLRRAEQIVWLNRLEVEHDNLRAALAHSLAAQECIELGLRLAGAIRGLWIAHDHHTEAWAWLERLLNRSRGVSTAARAKALTSASFILKQMGELATGRTLAEESLTTYRVLNDQIGVANALRDLGYFALKQGDDAQARSLFEQSLTIGREIGDQDSILFGLLALGHLAFAQRDYPRARPFYQECLALTQARGMKWSGAGIMIDLGDLAYRENDYATAEAMYEKSLELTREVGSPWDTAMLLGVLGRVALHQGNLARAASLLKDSLTLLKKTERKEAIGRSLETYAVLVAEQGQFERAGRLFGVVEALFESFHAPGAIDAFEPVRYNRALALARAQLDETAFNAAWEAGRKLTLEQAIEYALENVKTDR